MNAQSVLRFVAGVLAVLGVLSSSAAADEPAPPGKVRLPLQSYLSLLETAERTERQRAEELARQETPVAEVVTQRVSIGLEDREAAIASDFEVLLQGKTLQPVLLPLAGFPEKVDVRDEGGQTGTAAVAAIDGGGGVVFAATRPGRYRIHVDSRAGLGTGTGRLYLGRVAAPVASTEIDLPADLAWSSPGAVVVEEREEAGRRRVRLATARGEDTVLDVRRKVDSADAEKLLAESVVLTILQLRPEGIRRHDVVLYEVRRGGLGRFTVELPPGLEVEQAGTDEGTVVPVVETGRLTIHREHQLQGVGYLVLSSTLPSLPAAGIDLAAVKPEAEVRARYLAISSAVAADVQPLPEGSWTRVDTTDLPSLLSAALTALDLTAAWRLATDGAGARLAVTALPAAPPRETTIRRRDTTTLLTVDGTLLFLDRFVVDSRSRAGAALDVVLPAGGKLWSAKVDEQPVRPLERGGAISVPLGFAGGPRAEVEVVSVLEKALPAGRSELALDLPQVTAPVLLHRLRLLLPESASYRVRRGDLRYAAIALRATVKRKVGAKKPATPSQELEKVPTTRDPWKVLKETPGVLTDRINVGGNESGQQSAFPGPGGLAGGYANLYATIMDEQGEPLPGVTVTVQGKKGSAVQVTDARGNVKLTGLADGTYSLQAELEGFDTIDYPNIALNNGRNTTVEVTLASAVEEMVTVTAESPLLDEKRITTGATVSQTELEKIPTARDAQAAFAQEVEGLQQGLVGGVKPLPVAIPETGKALAFSGVLPPSRISLELEVKARR